MKRMAIVLIAFISLGVSAQDCGNGLPCGPIPWSLPQFPVLLSPTPAVPVVDPNPNIEPTHTPTATPTWTPTNTMTPTITRTPTNTALPTATPFYDGVEIQDQIGTLEAFMSNPQQTVLNVEGTPMFLEDLEDMNTNAGTFFSYVKGLNSTVFGPFTPLIGIILFSFVMGWFLGAIKFALPLIASVIGAIRKVISFILEIIARLVSFIPFFG